MINYLKENYITLYLKFMLGLLIIPAIVYFVVSLTSIVTGYTSEDPSISWAFNMAMILIMVIVFPYIYSIVLSISLLNQVERDSLYSNSALISLKRIGVCGVVVGCLFLLIEIPTVFIAEYDDAPGLIIVVFLFGLLSFGVTAFSVMISKLVSNGLNS